MLVRAIIVSQFAPPFMFSGVAIALPKMASELHAGATSQGLVETLFLAGHLAFLLPIGKLSDVADKRSFYKLGLLCFGLSSILIGSLSSMSAMLSLRFLQGVTGAVLSATGPALLSDLVPIERRGRVFGSSLGAAYAGLTLGPIVAGYLVDLWGWRAVFLCGAAVLLGIFLMIHIMMPSKWHRPTERVNLPSAGLVMAAVLSLVGSTSLPGTGGLALGLLLVAVALGTAFVMLQNRLARPVLDIQALVANRVLRNALLVQLLLYMNAFCSTYMLSNYLQVSLGYEAVTAGQVIAIGSLVMAALSPLAGRLADRVSPRLITGAGVACILVMTLIAMRLRQDSSLVTVGLALAFQGIGFGLFTSPNMTLIMNSVGSNAMGMASALGSKARSLGMVSGMLMTGFLISRTLGNAPLKQHPLAFIGVMTTVYAILSGLTCLALVLSYLTRARDRSAAPLAGAMATQRSEITTMDS